MIFCAVPRCGQVAVTIYLGFALCSRCLAIAYGPSTESSEIDSVYRAHGAVAVLNYIRGRAGLSNKPLRKGESIVGHFTLDDAITARHTYGRE